MKYSIEELKSFLKPLMSEKRYNHSIMVMEEAKEYLEKYGNNNKEFFEKTIRAALMHDIAKEMTEEEINDYIEKNNIELNIYDPINKPLIHGIVGAEKCIKEYGFDEEMANSIRVHTTGNINMSLMDKIVFLADKTGRVNRSAVLEKVREKAFINLDEGIYYYLEENIIRLKEKNMIINPLSIETKNYFLKKLNKIKKKGWQ